MTDRATAVSVQRPAYQTSPPALSVGVIIAFGVGKLLLHFLTTILTPYGIHRDEFLYLAMGRHLTFWRMDFPPAIAVLANTARFLFGDTLFAIRFFPALAGAAIVMLAGLLAREFGGTRFAQAMAMCAVLCCGLFLRPATLFQPVVFDQFCWTLGFFALAKICQSPHLRWWWLLGVAGGLGLLTKFSICFFAVSVAVGFAMTPQRRALTERWPWVAALVALLIGSPSIVGQLRLNLPVLIHMGDLRSQQLSRVTYGDFLFGQLSMVGPVLLLALVGLVALMRGRGLTPFRPLGWTCITAFILLFFLHGKPYYLGPIYPMLFAAGAATLQASPQKLVHHSTIALFVLIILSGIIGLPMGLPILPPEKMAKYAAALGDKSLVTTNRKVVLRLPQDYADMLGWEEQVIALAHAWQSLPQNKRTEAFFVASNYGQAGALEFFGPRYGLTRPILLPKNFLLWPPPATPCEFVITVGVPPEDVARFFKSAQLLQRFDNPWRVPEERQVPICIGESPIRDLHEAWPKQR